MEGKKSFVLYTDWKDSISKLSNEDIGSLFMAILNFVNGHDSDIKEAYSGLYYAITEQITIEWSKFNPKTGKYHWNYKGGITPENKIIRNSKEMKKWRLSVFERDNYTCQKCGEIGGELNAHHKLQFALFHSKRTEVSNGITLCKECHKQEHKSK